MDYQKIYHPHQFSFCQSQTDGLLDFEFDRCEVGIRRHGEHVFHLELTGQRWDKRQGLNELSPPAVSSGGAFNLSLDEKGRLSLSRGGTVILAPGPDGSIAVAGKRWMLEFAYDPSMKFFGMGEKSGALEKSGTRTKFWNTDVWADFHWNSIADADTDPMYVSIPYLIIRTDEAWVGVLLDNPFDTFISAGGTIGSIANQQGVSVNTRLYMGASQGKPSVWFIVGDTLGELTRHYQKLVGTTPLPPLWSLGHHQCRWGYGAPEDLAEVKAQMAHYEIPNSGLWLDIDYMNAYRVFTWNEDFWPMLEHSLRDLQADGQKVIPILDPGVKMDPDYAIYQSGHAADVWCTNEDGVPYVGYVWPGETLFPDYLLEEGRAWWADHVSDFAARGIEGAWCDMNDPSVGPVELDPMCFRRGEWPHAVGHNQYGAQMAKATRAGFENAHPDKRPFLLSRSGYTGSQQFTALWTGDNMSNSAYFESTIACTLNVALSGVPFNGPDVPGFGEDAPEWLARKWYQAGFLFPFLRNHSLKNTRAQEPYSFARTARETIVHLIRLRYRLLPYLYQLWIQHTETGDAILRPLLYDYDDVAFASEDHTFLIGPDLLQAPCMRGNSRTVHLPGDAWYDLCFGEWVEAGEYAVTCEPEHTPLYARAGAVIAMQARDPRDHRIDLSQVDLHCFLRPGDRADLVCHADDGTSHAWKDGERSTVRMSLRAEEDRVIVESCDIDAGWKDFSIRLHLYGGQEKVAYLGKTLAGEAFTWRATGVDLSTSCVKLT